MKMAPNVQLHGHKPIEAINGGEFPKLEVGNVFAIMGKHFLEKNIKKKPFLKKYILRKPCHFLWIFFFLN